MHIIKPISKSGVRNSIRNYRPISLLCVVPKVLERIVYKKLLISLSVFFCHQLGFLRGRSTLQELQAFSNTICITDRCYISGF